MDQVEARGLAEQRRLERRQLRMALRQETMRALTTTTVSNASSTEERPLSLSDEELDREDVPRSTLERTPPLRITLRCRRPSTPPMTGATEGPLTPTATPAEPQPPSLGTATPLPTTALLPPQPSMEEDPVARHPLVSVQPPTGATTEGPLTPTAIPLESRLRTWARARPGTTATPDEPQPPTVATVPPSFPTTVHLTPPPTIFSYQSMFGLQAPTGATEGPLMTEAPLMMEDPLMQMTLPMPPQYVTGLTEAPPTTIVQPPLTHLYRFAFSPMHQAPTVSRTPGIVKKCPGDNCTAYIEKISGCNHMVCERCRCDFCFECLGRRDQGHSPCAVRAEDGPNGDIRVVTGRLVELERRLRTLNRELGDGPDPSAPYQAIMELREQDDKLVLSRNVPSDVASLLHRLRNLSRWFVVLRWELDSLMDIESRKRLIVYETQMNQKLHKVVLRIQQGYADTSIYARKFYDVCREAMEMVQGFRSRRGQVVPMVRFPKD